MTEGDAGVIEQTVRISARPETVWRYWTDPERLCEWWGASAEVVAEPGGACVVEMHQGQVMRGEFLELVPHERIVFTFGWDPNESTPPIGPGSTRVEITLTVDGEDTILSLRHSGLPAQVVERHSEGWAYFLPMLVTTAGRGNANEV